MNIVKSFGVLTTGAYFLSNFCKSKFTVSNVDDQVHKYLSLRKKVRADEWDGEWDCFDELTPSESSNSAYVFICNTTKQTKVTKSFWQQTFLSLMIREEREFAQRVRLSNVKSWPPGGKFVNLLNGYRAKDREADKVNPTEHDTFVFNAQMECLFRSHFNRKKPKITTFVTYPEVVQFFICRLLQIPVNRSHLFNVQDGSITILNVNKAGYGSMLRTKLPLIDNFLHKMSEMAE